MKQTKNQRVLQFLQSIGLKNEYYASASDKSFLRLYDACDDFHLRSKMIKKVWEFLVPQFTSLGTLKSTVNPVSILHTNAGTGKVLSDCPSEATQITAMNNEIICKNISDLMNQDSAVDFRYSSEIGDISHYFIMGDKGNTREHDIVFTQPIPTDYYKGIDTTKVGYYDYLNYYSVRSLDFLVKGGYLCVFLHPNKFSTLKDNLNISSNANLVFESRNRFKNDEYGCLIFKKK
mgnify:CR=1 FL=1